MATYSNAPPGESDRLPNKLIPMVMHKPPHPGEFIEGVYLEPCALSIRLVHHCHIVGTKGESSR